MEADSDSAEQEMTRKIIHVDMDCFYAAIEARDDPRLRGKPLAVGGLGPRSVVATASYEARKYGVRSALPMFKARTLCPSLIVVEPRFDAYKAASRQVRDILLEYSPVIEPLSLDEAFIDVSGHEKYAWTIAREIRQKIRERTGVTASAGIAPNKMLAKIASDWRKPDGQFAILPGDVLEFMRTLPVGKIWGVGPKGRERLESLGLHTCGDLQALSRVELAQRVGSWGESLYDLSRGIDERPVHGRRPRKSLSNERTFDSDLLDLDACLAALDPQIEELREELERKERERPIVELVVKLKFADFRQTTRQCRGSAVDADTFRTLLEEAYLRAPGPVRLLGVGVRFQDDEDDRRWQQLYFDELLRAG